jgi:hypothetical protein
MSEEVKFILPDDRIPKAWYNLPADLPPAPRQSNLADRAFALTAASGGLAEVELANLAQQVSPSDASEYLLLQQQDHQRPAPAVFAIAIIGSAIIRPSEWGRSTSSRKDPSWSENLRSPTSIAYVDAVGARLLRH